MTALIVFAVAALSSAGAAAEIGQAGGISPVRLDADRSFSPPMGLLDFCEREPATCVGPTGSFDELAASLAQARRLAWRDILIGAGSRSQPRSVGPKPRQQALSSAPRPSQFLGGLDVFGLQSSDSERDRVTYINATLNQKIVAVSDHSLYGRADVWTVPGRHRSGRMAGDCEDYVLAKRDALLQNGIAPERLSIALARTPEGEDHAVLLVAFADGDYVLDNLDSRVLHWSLAGLVWQARQRPGELLQWIHL